MWNAVEKYIVKENIMCEVFLLFGQPLQGLLLLVLTQAFLKVENQKENWQVKKIVSDGESKF